MVIQPLVKVFGAADIISVNALRVDDISVEHGMKKPRNLAESGSGWRIPESNR